MPEEKTDNGYGDRPGDDQPAKPRVISKRVLDGPPRYHREASQDEAANDLEYIGPEVDDDCDEGTQLNDRHESGPLFGVLGIYEAHRLAEDGEVSGAAYWNELCETLNQAEKYRLPDGH